MKAVPGILPTLLEMICFFSTPTIDVEPNKNGSSVKKRLVEAGQSRASTSDRGGCGE